MKKKRVMSTCEQHVEISKQLVGFVDKLMDEQTGTVTKEGRSFSIPIISGVLGEMAGYLLMTAAQAQKQDTDEAFPDILDLVLSAVTSGVNRTMPDDNQFEVSDVELTQADDEVMH